MRTSKNKLYTPLESLKSMKRRGEILLAHTTGDVANINPAHSINVLNFFKSVTKPFMLLMFRFTQGNNIWINDIHELIFIHRDSLDGSIKFPKCTTRKPLRD